MSTAASDLGRQRRAADVLGRRRTLTDSLFGDPGFSYYVACVYLVLTIAFFTDQAVAARSAVGQALHPYDAIWNGLELLGALLIVASAFVRLRRHALEAGGLVLMLFAWAMQLVCSLAIQGLDDLRSWVFVPLIAGGALRYRRLLRQG